jgi:hypothetical protein
MVHTIQIEALALASKVHPKIVRNSIRLAFLAPDITASIYSGDHLHDLSLKNFAKEIPLDWAGSAKDARRRLTSIMEYFAALAIPRGIAVTNHIPLNLTAY